MIFSRPGLGQCPTVPLYKSVGHWDARTYLTQSSSVPQLYRDTGTLNCFNHLRAVL